MNDVKIFNFNFLYHEPIHTFLYHGILSIEISYFKSCKLITIMYDIIL